MGGENGDSRYRDRRPSEGVVVDIGGTVGALVVNAPPALLGAEIEICPVGTTTRTHTIVRAREVPGAGVVHAGVFPALTEGDYTLLAYGSLPEATVHIDGGAVTQFSW
jgi:hypothetical protein